MLIADDEPKRDVKDLWYYVSQLYIRNNSHNQYKREICIVQSYCPHLVVILIKTCSAILKGLTSDVVKDEG